MPPDNLPLLILALLLNERLELRLGERTDAPRGEFAVRRIDQVHRRGAAPRAARLPPTNRLERAAVVQEIREADLMACDEGQRFSLARRAVHRNTEHGRVLVAMRVVKGDHLGDLLVAHRTIRGPDRHDQPFALAEIFLECVRPAVEIVERFFRRRRRPRHREQRQHGDRQDLKEIHSHNDTGHSTAINVSRSRASTRPMIVASANPSAASRSTNRVAPASGTAISSPPEVWGSNSRSHHAPDTASPNQTLPLKARRLAASPPDATPSARSS